MDNGFGLKIKELRSKKSISLGYKYTGQMLANDLKISRSYLGDIETGRRKPNIEIIHKLSEVFDTPSSYFNNYINDFSTDKLIDSETKSIIHDIQKLSDENRKLLKDIIKLMLVNNTVR